MKSTLIDGVFELDSQIFSDKRGSFLSCFKDNDSFFKNIWLSRNVCQVNLSSTSKKGSIRGLHYQIEPFNECKIIRCLRGRVWDVAVDLRTNSKTYKKWVAVELCSSKKNAIFIPEGCAHGFQTLSDDSDLLYIHSKNYEPNHERGIRWNDPNLEIDWPLALTQISERDSKLPLFLEK